MYVCVCMYTCPPFNTTGVDTTDNLALALAPTTKPLVPPTSHYHLLNNRQSTNNTATTSSHKTEVIPKTVTELASFALRALVLLDTDTLPPPPPSSSSQSQHTQSSSQTDEGIVAGGIRQLFLQHGLAIIDSLLPVTTASPSNEKGVEEDGGGLMDLETLDWVSE